MLLSAWVTRDDDQWPCPQIDEAPEAVAVAMDVDWRGKGLCAYLLSLCARAEKEGESYPEVRLEIGVTLPGTTTGGFPSMDPTWVTMQVPDVEMTKLQTFDGVYPSWRKAMSSFSGQTTDALSFDPEIIGRLASLGKLHPGSAIGWEFGGNNRASRVQVIDSEPHVSGLVCPVRWDFETDAPWVKPGAPDDEDEDPF